MLGNVGVVKVNKGLGYIYLSEDKKGDIYIDGEYKGVFSYLNYGYDISSNILKDKDLIDDINILKATSKMWRYSNSIDTVLELIKNNILDVKYVKTVNYGVSTYKELELEKDINYLITLNKFV